jgi:small subunit ribosomal protein S18
MARNNERTSTRRSPKDAARRTKKKPCALCKDKIEFVDYKDVGMLRKYMSDRGKIRARRVTGNCAQHQSAIAMAIKTARELVLLPYTQRTTTERSGGRGRGGGRGGPDRGPGGPDRGPGGPDRGPRGPRAEAPPNGAGDTPAAGPEGEGASGNGDGSVAEPAEAGSDNGSAGTNGAGSEASAEAESAGEGGA